MTREMVERLLLADEMRGVAPARDVMETMQHDKVFRRLPRLLDRLVTTDTVLDMHRDVFLNIKSHAGAWRVMRVRILGTEFEPPRPEEVALLIREWTDEYSRRWVAGEDVTELAAWMHWRFESIHPFEDGNGRIGRLLLNLHFLRQSWPPVHLGPPDRREYGRALESGHKGDLAPMRALLEGAMGRSLLDLLDQVGTKGDELQRLDAFAGRGGHDTKYLALRASQGVLPAVKTKNRWMTSERAMGLYEEWKGKR